MEKTNFQYIQDTQTLIGNRTRELLDVETGEKITVNQITKRVYGSKNFWKCYLMDFLTILGIVDSKQLDVLIYIIENTHPATNIFLGTYERIMNNTGVSRPTVAKIMKKLQQANFIQKIQNGAWCVNPQILVKGGDFKQQILLSYYQDTGTDKPKQSGKLAVRCDCPGTGTVYSGRWSMHGNRMLSEGICHATRAENGHFGAIHRSKSMILTFCGY